MNNENRIRANNAAKAKEMCSPKAKEYESICRWNIVDAALSLNYLLDAIEKWETIAWDDFECVQSKFRMEYPDGFPHNCDPLADEIFIRHHTSLVLYGSLAVTIAAMVESELGVMFRRYGISLTKKKQSKKLIFIDYMTKPIGRIFKRKPSTVNKNPHLEDYIKEFIARLGCTRIQVKHYHDHLLVRALSNRFKHSGGQATKEFVKRYGKLVETAMPEDQRTPVEEKQDIPFDFLPWTQYIDEAKEFLLDISKRLCDKKEAEESNSDAG